jgi:hypothetical protein
MIWFYSRVGSASSGLADPVTYYCYVTYGFINTIQRFPENKRVGGSLSERGGGLDALLIE